MADKKEVHHIMLHQPHMGWFYGFLLLGLIAFVFVAVRGMWKIFEDEPEPPPFVVDLRSEEYPVELDYTSRYQIVVRVTKPDGVEVRLYNEDDGGLTGTFIEQPAAPEPLSTN